MEQPAFQLYEGFAASHIVKNLFGGEYAVKVYGTPMANVMGTDKLCSLDALGMHEAARLIVIPHSASRAK